MTWKFLSTGLMRHFVAMMISFLALGSLNSSFGQTETPQSSPSISKKQPTSLADNKVGDEFRVLFGEFGKASVTSISLCTAEAPKVLVECGHRVDVDAREFLIVWNAKEIPTDRKNQFVAHRRLFLLHLNPRTPLRFWCSPRRLFS